MKYLVAHAVGYIIGGCLILVVWSCAHAQQMAGPLRGTTPESRAAYIAAHKDFDLVWKRCKTVPLSAMKDGPRKRWCLKQSERMP